MLAAASVYSLVVPAGVAVAGDVGSVDLRAQFEARARTAWSKIVELSRKSDVELVEKQFRKDRVDEYHWTTKFADANVCYSIGYVNVPSFGGHRSGEGTVTCCNSRYGFELARTAKIRPWTVNYVGSDVGQVSEKALQEGAVLLPQFGLFVWMFFLPDLIEQDGFTVLGVEAVDRPTGRLAAVRFENKRPKDEIIFWIQGGTLVLNPQRMWAIEEYDLDVVFQQTGEARWWSLRTEFAPSPVQFPVVRKSLMRQGPKDGPEDFQQSWEFPRFELRNVPESEFELGAFGLPELVAPTTGRRKWVVFVSGGVVCIAVAIWLYRRRKSEAV